MASLSIPASLSLSVFQGGAATQAILLPPVDIIAGSGAGEGESPQEEPEIIKIALKKIDDFARSSCETALDLSNLGLSQITDDIASAITSKIPTLRTLNLSKNNFMHIPEVFFSKLPRIFTLDLSYNKISSIPESIEAAPVLSTVVLSYNKLTDIPESVARANFLSNLIVDANPIVSIADTVLRKNGLVIALTKNSISETFEIDTSQRRKLGLDAAIIDLKI